jgi:hypothetical protein
VGYRYVATQSSAVIGITWQPRYGSGYSLGDGGDLRISLQSDDGTSSHRPSGTILTSLTWSPGSSGSAGVVRRQAFPSPYTVTAGRIYHIVWENVDANPTQNYVSVNDVIIRNPSTYGDGPQRLQPKYDDIFALLTDSGSGWARNSSHLPNFDIEYANGAHDGSGYLGAEVYSYGLIGGSNQTRERFTVSGGDRTVTGVYARIGRQSGSGSVTLRLETSAGQLVDQVVIPGSRLTVDWTLGQAGPTTANGTWVGAQFGSQHILQNGQTYNLVLIAPSGSQYSMVPLLQRDGTHQGSYYMRGGLFTDGLAQRSTNGGSSWTGLTGYPSNCQFYFTTEGN